MEFITSFSNFLVENLNLVMILLGFFIIGMMFLLLYIRQRRKNKIKNIEIENNNKIIQKDKEEVKEDKDKQNIIDKDIVKDIKLGNKEDLQDSEEINTDKVKLQESTLDVNAYEQESNSVLDNYENVIKESDAMLEAMQNIIDDNIEEMQSLESQNIDTTEDVCSKDKINIVSKYKVLYDKVKKDWVVKKEGATRAAKRCATKEEAIEYAKECTVNAELGLTFHKKDGKFQKKAKKS